MREIYKVNFLFRATVKFWANMIIVEAILKTISYGHLQSLVNLVFGEPAALLDVF